MDVLVSNSGPKAAGLRRDDEAAGGLHPLTAVKLNDNPCWLSFRINYLALAFNTPVYEWIEQKFGLKRPEFVVLYSLFLKDGVAAKDICISSGFPKNTISRAVQVLLKRKLILRAADEADRRSFVLRLTGPGRACAEEALPMMVAREQLMLETLTKAERLMLCELLAKLVIKAGTWPAAINQKGTP